MKLLLSPRQQVVRLSEIGRMNCIKIVEHTYGTHAYMKMIVNGNEEEIDVFFRESGTLCRTSGDSRDDGSRENIIKAFDELY